MRPVIKKEGNKATIVLIGILDDGVYREFRQAKTEVLEDNEIQHIYVDFEQCPIFDDSGAGMLSLLKANADSQKKTVVLINCNEAIRQALKNEFLDRIFTVQ